MQIHSVTLTVKYTSWRISVLNISDKYFFHSSFWSNIEQFRNTLSIVYCYIACLGLRRYYLI